MTKVRYLVAFTLVAMFGLVQQGHSAGFALIEQSVKGQGRAFAGEAAAAEDASTIWYNPAGLMNLCGTQVVNALHVVVPTADYRDDGSIFQKKFPPDGVTQPGPDGGGGETGRNGGVTGFVPNLYVARVFDCGIALGLGINAPFGLETEYTETWVGRYHAIKSKMATANINPSVAWKLCDCLSVGAGFNMMFVTTTLTNAVDGGLLLSSTGLADFTNPQQSDFYAKVVGRGWGFGYNVGLLWDVDCCTRVGLAYRSKVVQHLHGDVEYRIPALSSNPAIAAQIEGALRSSFPDAGAKADATLPSSLSLSAYHQWNECVALLADVSWTHWHKFNELRIRFNSDQADSANELDWSDNWRYSVGLNYRPYTCVTLRTGVAYETTPIPNKLHRTPRIPDNNRVWLSLGGGFDWSPCVHFDVAYTHLFVKDPKIDKSSFELSEDFVKGGLLGHYDARTDIFAVQGVLSF